VTVVTHVRFVVSSMLTGRIKPGDRDTTARAFGRGATLTAVGPPRSIGASEAIGRLFPVVGPLSVLEATLDVPVDAGVDGWSYKDQTLKAGTLFTFETAQYVVHGDVIDVLPPLPAASSVPPSP
jgi:hypothetical protein